MTDERNSENYIPSSCISLPIPKDKIEHIASSAKDFALLNGAGMRYQDRYNPEILEMAPIFLLPSPFPKRDFDYVMKLQPTINLLMHKVAHDYDFLSKCLKKTVLVDDFTARLWNIYETVRKEGISQDVSLGMLRSDVMLSTCDPDSCLTCSNPPFVASYQVEVNTIASGFGHLGPISAEIHRYVLSSLGMPDLLHKLPENPALEKLCEGMICAFDVYDVPSAVIMFLVEDVTYNICDQRFHEYEIMRRRPEIRVIRKSLTEVSLQKELKRDKRLFVDGKEVAVVYFRSAYEPSQYPTEAEWEARLDIERSKAIKSPNIHYHLAGSKKVQQELARPGVLNKYLSPEVAEAVANLFTGLYSLDENENGEEVIDKAIKNPENFVLKPQREGGGNNVYGKEIRQVLEKIRDGPERNAYILMDLINPPVQKNYIVRPHELPRLVETLSELGIFGVLVGSEDKIVMNETAGHMLRTKLATQNEGGVAAGHGALDSVFLI